MNSFPAVPRLTVLQGITVLREKINSKSFCGVHKLFKLQISLPYSCYILYGSHGAPVCDTQLAYITVNQIKSEKAVRFYSLICQQTPNGVLVDLFLLALLLI